MDTASRVASEVQEVCEEVRSMESLDKQRREDMSPLRTALRAYLAAYPNVTAARVGPQGDDL